MADIIIRNGRVVDGTGNPWFRADIAITNGPSLRSANANSCKFFIFLEV